MNKALIWIIVIVVALVIGFYALNKGEPKSNEAEKMVAKEQETLTNTQDNTEVQNTIETDDDVINEIDSALEELS